MPVTETSMCEACGERAACVFTPDFALCKPCRKYQADHAPVNASAAGFARSLGGGGARRFAEAVDRVDVALDQHDIPRSREAEAFDDWLDTYADVDFNESEAVR